MNPYIQTWKNTNQKNSIIGQFLRTDLYEKGVILKVLEQ